MVATTPTDPSPSSRSAARLTPRSAASAAPQSPRSSRSAAPQSPRSSRSAGPQSPRSSRSAGPLGPRSSRSGAPHSPRPGASAAQALAPAGAGPLSLRHRVLQALRAEHARREAALLALAETADAAPAAAQPAARPDDACPTEESPPEPGAPVSARAARAAASARPFAPEVPGAVLAGRYELVEPVGEGGMGWVWRARSIGLDIDVAVKIARAGAVPHAGERLLREARVSARVRHPASVRVIELCRSEAGPLLVMELLQGRTLARALADGGPLAPLRAVTLLLPILGALAAAHREGIVHRDVKPTNIVLAEEGRRTLPKLIDFGIACVSPNEWSQRLTPHTPLLGSPAYMSPEQASGATGIDPRTDVWGACTVLYEAVSGERPFTGGDRVEITRGILTAPARRPAALAGYPALWRIIERGLQKAPADRWESMEALGAALAMWALDQGARCDAAGAGLAEEWCPRRRG